MALIFLALTAVSHARRMASEFVLAVGELCDFYDEDGYLRPLPSGPMQRGF